MAIFSESFISFFRMSRSFRRSWKIKPRAAQGIAQEGVLGSQFPDQGEVLILALFKYIDARIKPLKSRFLRVDRGTRSGGSKANQPAYGKKKPPKNGHPPRLWLQIFWHDSLFVDERVASRAQRHRQTHRKPCVVPDGA
ncbi:hypothetical protein JCM15831A_17850 [Asaia astilbis]